MENDDDGEKIVSTDGSHFKGPKVYGDKVIFHRASRLARLLHFAHVKVMTSLSLNLP